MNSASRAPNLLEQGRRLWDGQPGPNRPGDYAGFASPGVSFVLDLAITTILALAVFWMIDGTLTLFRIDVDQCVANVALNNLQSLLQSFCRFMHGAKYAFSLVMPPAYFVLLWYVAGQTVGMAVVGIRIVRTDGNPLTLPVACVRLVALVVSIVTLGIGLLWCLVDDRRQGWHDKLAGTCVRHDQ